MSKSTHTIAHDGTRPLHAEELSHLLAAVGVDEQASLQELQWAFLKFSVFHNLELLAGCSPRTAEGCIEAVLQGRGGPCHVQATGFLATLRALGYDAHLAAATVTNPGDHLVVIVNLGAKRYVCDVGNGHPYTNPFDLAGDTSSTHLGWHFLASGQGDTLTLSRQVERGVWKKIYTLDPSIRRFESFLPIIDAHHERPGFGPFLRGLRVVSISDHLVVTLRDQMLTRYGIAGATTREVPGRQAASSILRQTFKVEESLVNRALKSLHFVENGSIKPTPRVVISLSTMDRPDNLEVLFDGLRRDWSNRARPDNTPLTILVIENSTAASNRKRNHSIVSAFNEDPDLDVIYHHDGCTGLSIALSREKQQQLLALRYLEYPFDVVWMVDDDLELPRFVEDHGLLHKVSGVGFFNTITRCYHERPEVSVLVGEVCGDPPIRPDVVLATQFLDLSTNLERFTTLEPDASYPRLDQEDNFTLPDYSYDHSQQSDAHLTVPFYWLQRRQGSTVREEALGFTEDMSGAFYGKTPTRPILARVRQLDDISPTPLRGGSAVFLDIDALFRHTYPHIEMGHLTSKCADMIGAIFLGRSPATCVARFPEPILHDRHGPPDIETTQDIEHQRNRLLSALTLEFIGVMSVRLVQTSAPLELDTLSNLVERRLERILKLSSLTAARAIEVRTVLATAKASWMGQDNAISTTLTRLDHALTRAQYLYLGGTTPDAQREWHDRLERVIQKIDWQALLEHLITLPQWIQARHDHIAQIFSRATLTEEENTHVCQ